VFHMTMHSNITVDGAPFLERVQTIKTIMARSVAYTCRQLAMQYYFRARFIGSDSVTDGNRT